MGWVDGVRSLGQSPKQFFCQPSLLPSSVYFNWNLCCTFIINIDFVNLYICTMYLFHINSIKYVYSTFHSFSQQMIFRGISILLDIKIFRIHGRFGLFKAFKTFQTEMKLPFFDPSLELFSQLVCLFHFHLFFNRNFPR